MDEKEARVKFQLSGIWQEDLMRAQKRALDHRVSLSAVLRSTIVLYGITGSPTGDTELTPNLCDFLNERLRKSGKSITPAHHRRRIKTEISDYQEDEKERRESAIEDLEDQLDNAGDEMITKIRRERLEHKKRYFKPRPLSDYRSD